ncbi:MAG: NADH-quinone oxidoreductase subunit G [Intrasporangium sp.]|uniref:NADH-quinone oxidoreductase subunit G n=1 Tax=Intrasporangium sp. TaxID=1925024 RepID=UPI0026475FA2|nr:NADH-quinone oxidoreductase subunit G [Intrasporangium sp.]MDN5794647.1 NADH-quinone oxidoreductase subunit G [Intrasporangium sp.]
MTTTTSPGAGGNSVSEGGDAQVPKGPNEVTVTIDGVPVNVPKGTLVIRAAERIGIEIPRFCDHPLLDPIGACRQCLVDVALPDKEGTPRPMPKPQASCTMVASEGMVVNTQNTSAVADKAQHGIIEFLLVNHPLDCPVCDKGGECPLQNQSMSNGRPDSRYEDVKRTYPKPINVSAQILLDRDRCILCTRCTRFADEIAGDPYLVLAERGGLQQVSIYEEKPFDSYFSGNTVQICPVGALTGAAYRFRSRPFDLVSTSSVCEHCASGCGIRTDHRRGVVLRRMGLNTPEVNAEWNCDKGRWAFTYATQPDRIELPMVRGDDGDLRVVGWPEALAVAAKGLAGSRAGVLVGGRVSAEDAYAYGKFARTVLGTNDVDFRARPHTAEEADFLARHVVGTGVPEAAGFSEGARGVSEGAAEGTGGGTGVSYADLEQAKAVLLVGFEPEDESPIVFLRLRKAFRKHGTRVFSVAPFTSRGLKKMGGTLVPTAPGHEAETLRALAGSKTGRLADEALTDGGIVLVGERLAQTPGALTAAAGLAAAKGARLAWVPRRAGERGALEAGAIGHLLPGGRPVTDPAARAEVAAVWESGSLPQTPGRDSASIIAAAADGTLDALVVGGVDPLDLALPEAAAALERAFVVSFELRESAVTAVADVVLPVAPHAHKAGSFVDWEGRVRPFERALSSNAVSDYRAIDMLASEMGHFIETRTQAEIQAQFEALGPWSGQRAAATATPATPVVSTGAGEFVLATWATLLDAGRMQDGEPFLAGTAPRTVARVSPRAATWLGVGEDDTVTVTGPGGAVTVPAVIAGDMVDGVVWLPTNSPGCSVYRDLGARAGDHVNVTKGGLA